MRQKGWGAARNEAEGTWRFGLVELHHDRPHVPGVAGLVVVEGRNVEVDRPARLELHVVLAAGQQVAAQLQRPPAIRPLRRAANLVAVTLVFALDQGAWNDR